jgi:hypothetical protein
MKITNAPFLAAVLAIALTPVAAWAQQGGTPPEPAPEQERRPFRGIFGSPPDLNANHSLMFNGSLYGAYDDNVLGALTARGRGAEQRRLNGSGGYGGAHAGLNYGLRFSGERLSVGLSAGAQLRYIYYDNQSSFLPSYQDHASASTQFSLTRSLTLTAVQTVGFTQNHRFRLFPVEGQEFEEIEIDDGSIAPDPDLDLFQMSALRLSSRVTLNQNFGQHTTLSGGYSFRYVNFIEADEGNEPPSRQYRDYGNHSVHARFQHSRPLSVHATLHLGYGIRMSDGRAGTGEPRAAHHINAGVSYSRALSISRRTSLNFSSGSTILSNERLSETNADPRLRFRINGNLSLVHELGRTWTARATYRRGLVFREGFEDPFDTDGASAAIGGLVTRRLAFSANGAWALSTMRRDGQTGHRAFAGSAQLTYALSKYFAAFAQYHYYEFSFGQDIPLDPQFPRALDRQGARAGITTSIQLF